jgi:hypothetical protein
LNTIDFLKVMILITIRCLIRNRLHSNICWGVGSG